MVQAEDRAHRIGRETDVNIEYLIAKNTADEWIWSLIQKKLETLKGAGLGNSVAEEKHEDMKQEKVEEIEDGFDDDDDFDDLVAQLDNDPTATLKSSIETPKISNKRKSDSTNIPDAKKKNKLIPSSDNHQKSSSVAADFVDLKQDTDIESNDSKNDTFDEDFPSDFED